MKSSAFDIRCFFRRQRLFSAAVPLWTNCGFVVATVQRAIGNVVHILPQGLDNYGNPAQTARDGTSTTPAHYEVVLSADENIV